eukprot:13132861-Ditylum_brightwellii.AAC.1
MNQLVPLFGVAVLTFVPMSATSFSLRPAAKVQAKLYFSHLHLCQIHLTKIKKGTCADIHCPYQHLAPSCGDNVVFGWKEKPVLSFKDDNNVIHESFGLLQLNNNRRIAPLLPELRLSLPPIFPNNSREAVVGCTDYGGEESSQKRDANRIQRKQWQRGIHASATALEDKHASNMKLPEKIS